MISGSLIRRPDRDLQTATRDRIHLGSVEFKRFVCRCVAGPADGNCDGESDGASGWADPAAAEKPFELTGSLVIDGWELSVVLLGELLS